MSFEKGGRADKQGNVYENRCLARILIRLVAEEIASVVVEPVEENSDICEFYTVAKNGSKTYYQCKGSNGMNDHWRPSDLQGYNLFSRVQALLRSDPTCRFCFVSPFILCSTRIQHKSKCWVRVEFSLLVYCGTTLFCLQYHKGPKC